VTVVEAALDEIAAALERALDITALSSIAGIPNHLSKGMPAFDAVDGSSTGT
jgi:hypothetical protein